MLWLVLEYRHILRAVYQVPPGGRRDLNAKLKEAQRGVCDDGSSHCQRCCHRHVRYHSGKDIGKDQAPSAGAHRLRSRNVVYLPERQHLTADQSSFAGPAQETDDLHDVENTRSDQPYEYDHGKDLCRRSLGSGRTLAPDELPATTPEYRQVARSMAVQSSAADRPS